MTASLAMRVGAALKKRAPETNRKGWLGKLADELNVSDDAASNWLHGYNAPSAENLEALYEKFGQTFANDILNPIGFVVAHESDAAVVEGAIGFSEAYAALRAVNQVSGEALEKVAGRLREAAG